MYNYSSIVPDDGLVSRHMKIQYLELRIRALEAAAAEAMSEIEYWHEDMLSEKERAHPRRNGWARVYDKLKESCSQKKEG